MKNCPYPRCNHNFQLEYSIGTCQKCKQFIQVCTDCDGYNREFARFCRLCGKPLEKEKIEQIYYTRKFQKTSHLILNKFALKKLDFIEPGQTLGMLFVVFSGNRVIITSPNGFLFDWDFVTRKQFNRMKIPDVEKRGQAGRSKPNCSTRQIIRGAGFIVSSIFPFFLSSCGKNTDKV